MLRLVPPSLTSPGMRIGAPNLSHVASWSDSCGGRDETHAEEQNTFVAVVGFWQALLRDEGHTVMRAAVVLQRALTVLGAALVLGLFVRRLIIYPPADGYMLAVHVAALLWLAMALALLGLKLWGRDG